MNGHVKNSYTLNVQNVKSEHTFDSIVSSHVPSKHDDGGGTDNFLTNVTLFIIWFKNGLKETCKVWVG